MPAGRTCSSRGVLLRARPPPLPNLSARTPSEPNDLALRWLFAVAVLRPSLGERSPLLEKVTAPVRGLDLVADRVSERHFPNLAREIRLLSSPVREA